VFRDAPKKRLASTVKCLRPTCSAGTGRVAITRRFPLSPVAGITPFTFRCCLRAQNAACDGLRRDDHAEAAARRPVTTLRLGELVKACGYPAGAVQHRSCHVESRRSSSKTHGVRVITFTGSAKAGWAIRAKAARNACCLSWGQRGGDRRPDADSRGRGALCGGRLYLRRPVVQSDTADLRPRIRLYAVSLTPFLDGVQQLKVAMYSTSTRCRADDRARRGGAGERWIAEAVAGGAGLNWRQAHGVFLEPTVPRTPPHMKVNCEESRPARHRHAYAGERCACLGERIPYGLQAGVFTTTCRRCSDFRRAGRRRRQRQRHPRLPRDRLPYGGAKASASVARVFATPSKK